MTETLQPPAPAPAPPAEDAGGRPRPPLVDGALAAVVAAALGLLAVGLPVLLLWAADPRTGASLPDALRAAGQLWLVVHGAAVELPTGRIALTPLGLLVLPLLLLLARAGRSVSRRLGASSLRTAARAALVVAAPYAAVAGAVALASGTGPVRADGVSVLLHSLPVALVGAAAGALRPDRLERMAYQRLGAGVRRSLAAALAASAVLSAGGALAVAGSLALRLASAADLAAATAPGPVGGVGLLALGLALVPNAVVWGAAWLAGPGFAVGVGTAVGPFGHEVGALPALPLLAALPRAELPTEVGLLALLVPLAAGGVAGHLLHRSAARPSSALRAAADAAGAAACCGALWAALAWLSGGGLGWARLAEVGPSPWRVGLAVAAEVGVGVLAARLVLGRRG
jgi:hypothetical protein